MSQLTSPLRHPVVACVEELELLDGVADLDAGYLSTGDKADVLVRLTRLGDRVEGLRLRVMANAMDVADVEGGRRWPRGWRRGPGPRPGAKQPTPACGGRTDLADGMLLCSWHHHRIHDERYLVQRTPDGAIRFHRRT